MVRRRTKLTYKPENFENLKWRNIGPPRGGRCVAVAGDPVNPGTFYFGACAGGVWKTTDGGTYWENVSDGYFNTASVGALAVATSDPNVIYAGMGESCIRNNVSHGDGVYRSNDGGRTWEHLGLEETLHISRVRIHPTDPDVVYVGALGDIFKESEERGVYRSKDGGRKWEKVLFKSPKAGIADLWLDPSSPRILFASVWQVRRMPWRLESGGPDSGLYRSIDGGDTWQEITSNHGLPKGLKGRMGVTSSPANGNRVWALIEAEKERGGLYRSDDLGETWDRISEDRNIQGRPWYYSHIVADPSQVETIYAMNMQFFKSIDGGRSFHQVQAPHVDHHDLWIDPSNSSRMIEGSDGGAIVSFNGGQTFSDVNNQMTAQIYRLTTDNQFPYRVYGSQQDNSAISVPSRTKRAGIPYTDCYSLGVSESGDVAVDPKNPDIVFSAYPGGRLSRYDHSSRQVTIVSVWPEQFFGQAPANLEHRFSWTTPMAFSRHNPTVLYAGGERLFKSTDSGMSWEAISPDLSRNDASKLETSGGPITKDATSAENYCTVFSIEESPLKEGLIWVGTDDGLIHLTRNGGSSWKNVTPSTLHDWSQVCAIDASHFKAGTAYVAANRYMLGDQAPYLFKTTDYGKSWEPITKGLPKDDFTRVIRSDLVRPGLLFSGTETAIYISFDDGASWNPLQLNLPRAPVYDLEIHGDDLVAATHGRSFWILDDITPLRNLDEAPGGFRLFDPPPTPRFHTFSGQGFGRADRNLGRWTDSGRLYERRKADGTLERVFLDAGSNPPGGVPISYFLGADAKPDEVELKILDARGKEIASFTPEREDEEPIEPPEEEKPEPLEAEQLAAEAETPDSPPEDAEPPPEKGPEKREGEKLPRSAGFNRFYWDMRHPGAISLPNEKGHRIAGPGPTVLAGTYTARLRLGKQEQESTFEIFVDPQTNASKKDLRDQFSLQIALRDKMTKVNDGIAQIRKTRPQVDAWSKRKGVDKEIGDFAKKVSKELTAIEERLTNPKIKGILDAFQSPGGLDSKLADLWSSVRGAPIDLYGSGGMGSDAAPTEQARKVFEKLSKAADEALTRLDDEINDNLAKLNKMIVDAGLPVIDTTIEESSG